MNNLINLLIDLNISDKNSLVLYHKGVRDSDEINVLHCKKSGILILDKIITKTKYYDKNLTYSKDQTVTNTVRGVLKSSLIDDDIRRYDQNKELCKNKYVLDFGSGQGGFIKLISKVARKAIGIEINQINRKLLSDKGFDVRKSLDDIKVNEKFDFVILNHSFEHLHEPVSILKKIKKVLKKNGKLVIEVPHSKDFLIKTLNCNDFKAFTFFSEHLILHTKKSLMTILEHSGFKTIRVDGFQRYSISNHFYWLSKGKPGGHEKFNFMNQDLLIKAYNEFLIDRGETDTIIGYFTH